MNHFSANTTFEAKCNPDFTYTYPTPIYDCVLNTQCNMANLPPIASVSGLQDDSTAGPYLNDQTFQYSCSNPLYSLFDNSGGTPVEIVTLEQECLWGDVWKIQSLADYSCDRKANMAFNLDSWPLDSFSSCRCGL